MRWLVKGLGHLLSPISRRFYRALTQPQVAQREVQQRLIKHLQHCEYGHSFGIQSCDDWQRLPIVQYDDLKPWIARSRAQPHQPVLTPEPIRFYEPTSGSSGPVKHIPYTRSLLGAFNHLFCLWAHDLITHGPAFSTGKLYFSISPSFTGQSTVSPGTHNDSDYLAPWLRGLLRAFWVMPPGAQTPSAFKENLARILLTTEALEIISIWSPSFLTAQLNYIYTHRQRLQHVLQDHLSSERSRLLRQGDMDWSRLWPQLKLISCWDSVTAADGAAGLRSQFPNVLVQGKGLLATEAPMTLPLMAAEGYVPLLDQVFFEFEDSRGQCLQLHQLAVGQEYEVIVSQTGGFYRYRMGDRVRVTHRFLDAPCLQFLGRGQAVSDLVGEKLHFQFVSSVLDHLDLPVGCFQSVVPVCQPTHHYVLLLSHCDREVSGLAQQFEQALCQSFHYHLARQLGQLAPARVVVSATIAEQLSALRAQAGQRWGDIKHPRLTVVPIDLAPLNLR